MNGVHSNGINSHSGEKLNKNNYEQSGVASSTGYDYKSNRVVEGRLENENENHYTQEVLENIAKHLLGKTNIRPKIGIICGSGIGSLADTLTKREAFPYEDIPDFPVSTVQGHVGRLVFGYLNEAPVMCMQGRFHFYEGYPLWKCSMPVRVMKLVGCSHLIVTNAAGGINQDYNVGDIMIIKDHINFLGYAGNNPLRGPNLDKFGPRFLPMNISYDRGLIFKAKEIAKEMKIDKYIKEGVYACLGGPNYETIAEIRMLKTCGADAVGMSTAHEVMVARHCGMTIFAFSLITNKSVIDYDSQIQPNHEEIIDLGKRSEVILKDFVAKMVSYINSLPATDENN